MQTLPTLTVSQEQSHPGEDVTESLQNKGFPNTFFLWEVGKLE